MANFELPRRGSSPHLCLSALSNIGGEATIRTLMNVRSWRGSGATFRADIIARLQRCGLIDAAGELCVITPAGRKYLGLKVEEAQGHVAEPAGPRYVPPMRPLNLARHRPARPIRPGSLDYQNIPSRMGGESVGYKGVPSLSGDAL